MQRSQKYPHIHSDLLYTLIHHPDYTPAKMLAEHQEWACRHADPLFPATPAYANTPEPNRRLRIGYVSPDFRGHVVGINIRPFLMGHTRDQFEIFCYSSTPSPDDLTNYLKPFADHWRDVVHLSDEALAAQIREDRIDILVMLAMHTIDSRILAAARKPAPIQINYLGYFQTGGMRAMDYLLLDEQGVPSNGSDAFFVEKIFRLPTTFAAYHPNVRDIPASPPPSLAKGSITFGSFNAVVKIHPGVVELWSKVLHAVPNSTLLMKARSLGDPSVRKSYEAQFERHGIPASWRRDRTITLSEENGGT